jgi:hypothetical protein
LYRERVELPSGHEIAMHKMDELNFGPPRYAIRDRLD